MFRVQFHTGTLHGHPFVLRKNDLDHASKGTSLKSCTSKRETYHFLIVPLRGQLWEKYCRVGGGGWGLQVRAEMENTEKEIFKRLCEGLPKDQPNFIRTKTAEEPKGIY